MNSKLSILLIVIACIIGIFAGVYYKNSLKKIPSQTKTYAGIPLTLDIPSIHVHAKIEDVGLDRNDLMDVPNNTNDVAWYKLGPKPGQSGNAVIDGHVDTQTGAPAVFAKLGKIKVGDMITVTETQTIMHTFKVMSIESLPTETFPTNRIFGDSTDAHLNLITCAGTWDTKTANYSKRLVVFSELIK
jgi:sortase A